MSDMVLGSICVAVFIVACFFLGKVKQRWDNLQQASLLSPLAHMVNGAVDRRNGWLEGIYQGRKLHVTVVLEGISGEGGGNFQALKIEIMNLPGRQIWYIAFEATKLGFGPNQPKLVVVRDPALEARFKATSILEEVGRVSAATSTYVTVQYQPAQKKLTYTDDISPRRIPTQEQFEQQLALAARLADLNESFNT